ncbi:uncharacterized protein LOC115478317 [Microcaecilia unicolor]|uniref:Uncharacterized protein LOC115478317 n=1 Tax=Microcaecilia unicolor TaxID=1415580 RepID=A0A6P7YWH8_9AMPH|nr:uncharacterized protein LOC115478317 [Microcaecilia unicolor]
MIIQLISALRSCTIGVAHGTYIGKRLLHDSLIRISSCVKEALNDGKPVVALESTIISHGMPYPCNISIARKVEDIVRHNGSVPATVGVICGRIHIGLSEEELQVLGKSNHSIKISRRDLPHALSQGLSGGTTVSATMIAAHKAGIKVFVTGGIGGVHHGGECTMDVSADLTELGRTPVAVVSAGVKSMMDIGRTLEYLETQGVCVATFGESKEFPAFFSHRSGFKAPCNIQNEEEAAKLIASSLELGLGCGVLLAVPIPKEYTTISHIIEEAVQQALQEARLKGIVGKEVTPFLLQKVNELTDASNKILPDPDNARVGSRIAVALSKILNAKKQQQLQTNDILPSASRLIVIGGINIDFIMKAKNSALLFGGQTNPCIVYQSFGGVGRNLADILYNNSDTFVLYVLSHMRHGFSWLHFFIFLNQSTGALDTDCKLDQGH